MNFKVETSKLKKAMAAVQAGMGGGKVLPITAYIKIEACENVLKITSTTLNTYLTSIAEAEVTEQGEAVVAGEQLIKLVNKTTKKEMKFELIGSELLINGNGNYEMPVLNEQYPSYVFGDIVEEGEIEVSALQSIFAINKSSIANDMTMPCLTGYMVGEKAITTDSVKMCVNEIQLFEERMLIPPELASLMSLFSGEKVSYQIGDERILLKSPNLNVFGSALEGIEDYPNVGPILESDFGGSVKVNTKACIDILERLDIFADMLNVNGVCITFGEKEMKLSDLKGKNEETILYSEGVASGGEEVSVNLKFMIDILKVISQSEFELFYGNGDMIKIKSGNVVHLLCQIDERR